MMPRSFANLNGGGSALVWFARAAARDARGRIRTGTKLPTTAGANAAKHTP
jgi:hypothetical protein